MRRAVTLSAAAVALTGPTVLAFYAGGFFDVPRLIAAFVTWGLVLVAAVTSPRPLPTSWPGRLALGAFAFVGAWTAASLAWAPLAAAATDNVVRLLLYVGALTAAAALLRGQTQLRALEPVLALGAFVVIGYGIAGRLLPGLIELSRSRSVGGRLEQPLTYWNAEGALAAMGFVLCARLAGDRSRSILVRALGAAGAAPLGAGLYITYSRGALAAGVVGLAVLLAAAPTRSQLRGVGLATAAALVAAIAAAALPAVSSLEGSLAERETAGLVMLAILVVTMVATGLASAWSARAEERHRLRTGKLSVARYLPAVAGALVALAAAGLIVGGLGEKGHDVDVGDERSRLTSLHSRRYDYWRIGLNAFADHPLKGVGTGGFRVEWLRERPVEERARDIHSLQLEMATELGIVGLLALGLFLTGAGVAARRALASEAPVAGAAAATAVWLLHSTIDWDFQVPAVTLPALVMIGAFIAASEDGTVESSSGGAAGVHDSAAPQTAVA